MELINKKISNLEKALTEMKKEITTIKNSTNNTNSANSLNSSNNFKNINNPALKTNRESIQRAKNILRLSKNYFQLTEKEKHFPNEKKLVKNTHSFHLNKKGLNIYNNIFLNSANRDNKDDKYKTIEKEDNKEFIDDKNQDKIDLNLILGKKDKINDKIKLDDCNINKSFKDNFRNKNQDLFFNYKLNNQKLFKRYFTNNISINKIGNTNSFNKAGNKKLNKYDKNSKSSFFQFEKKRNQKDNNFEVLINNKNKENEDDITCYYEKQNNNCVKNQKKSIIKYYIPKEEYKYNYSSQNDIINSYKSILDENIDYTNYLANNRNDNKIKKDKNENLKKENAFKEYSQMLTILKEESINNLIIKSVLFDKYGSKGFNHYINNNGKNISKDDLDSIYNNLDDYKNYISSIGKRDELGDQIKNYKIICNKLIKVTNAKDIKLLIEDINIKIRKNPNNKNTLEKVKNILGAY